MRTEKRKVSRMRLLPTLRGGLATLALQAYTKLFLIMGMNFANAGRQVD